jgi:acyl-CoA thioester hydrolase
MYTAEHTVRVRYAETDQMGIAYYGSYAAWLEVARVETLRSLGLTYRTLEEQGVMLPVADLQISYLKPVRYDDELRIVTTIGEMPSVRIRFEYRCFVGDEEVTRASTTLFFMDAATRRPRRCPESLSSALRRFFE